MKLAFIGLVLVANTGVSFAASDCVPVLKDFREYYRQLAEQEYIADIKACDTKQAQQEACVESAKDRREKALALNQERLEIGLKHCAWLEKNK